MIAVPSQCSIGWLLLDVSVPIKDDLHAASSSGDEFHVDTYCSFVVIGLVFDTEAIIVSP